MRVMVIIVPMLSGYASVLHVAVSLPRVDLLMDGKKYLEPADVPPPESRDLRRLRQGKVKPRAPTLRSMVRLAVRCDSAEELGRKLRQRYERRRIESGRPRQAEAELDRLLAQD
jgi:hypothetical protein